MKYATIMIAEGILLLCLTFGLIDVYAQTDTSHSLFEHYPPVIIESEELPVRDADGIALGDLTGDGKIDILTSDGDYDSFKRLVGSRI